MFGSVTAIAYASLLHAERQVCREKERELERMRRKQAQDLRDLMAHMPKKRDKNWIAPDLLLIEYKPQEQTP